jgi:hypothetical protein
MQLRLSVACGSADIRNELLNQPPCGAARLEHPENCRASRAGDARPKSSGRRLTLLRLADSRFRQRNRRPRPNRRLCSPVNKGLIASQAEAICSVFLGAIADRKTP